MDAQSTKSGTLTYIKPTENKITPNVDHVLACANCIYTLHCLRRNYPRVCGYCRTAIFISFVDQMARMFMSPYDKLILEHTYVACQPAHHRVSSACPLFHASSVKCVVCYNNDMLKDWKRTNEVSQQ